MTIPFLYRISENLFHQPNLDCISMTYIQKRFRQQMAVQI